MSPDDIWNVLILFLVLIWAAIVIPAECSMWDAAVNYDDTRAPFVLHGALK